MTKKDPPWILRKEGETHSHRQTMNSKRVQVSTTLPYLAVIPLIILGIVSILATGGGGGGGSGTAPPTRAAELLVGSASTNEVLRYDGTTGAFIDVFASGGGLIGPVGLVFGPDGHLYVSSSNNHQVLRYNGAMGAFIDAFVTAGSGGLNSPLFLIFK